MPWYLSTFTGVIAIKIHYFCFFLACSCSCHIRCADKLPTCPITPSQSESHPSLTTAIYCTFTSQYPPVVWMVFMAWGLHSRVGCVLLNQAVCVRAGAGIMLSSVTLNYLYTTHKLTLLPCLLPTCLISSKLNGNCNKSQL